LTEVRDVVEHTAAALDWAGSVTAELDWETVEGRLETPLPDDFKQFAARFPSGMFRDAVRFFNPVQSDEFLTHFKDASDRILMGAELMWEEFGTYPPFPRPGGVIPFAAESSGGALLWLPWTPDPDEWHVVHLSSNTAKGYTRTKRSMTAVMLELATSRSERNVLGWDLATVDRSFKPFR
jgi:hypothetical protein